MSTPRTRPPPLSRALAKTNRVQPVHDNPVHDNPLYDETDPFLNAAAAQLPDDIKWLIAQKMTEDTEARTAASLERIAKYYMAGDLEEKKVLIDGAFRFVLHSDGYVMVLPAEDTREFVCHFGALGIAGGTRAVTVIGVPFDSSTFDFLCGACIARQLHVMGYSYSSSRSSRSRSRSSTSGSRGSRSMTRSTRNETPVLRLTREDVLRELGDISVLVIHGRPDAPHPPGTPTMTVRLVSMLQKVHALVKGGVFRTDHITTISGGGRRSRGPAALAAAARRQQQPPKLAKARAAPRAKQPT